MAPDGVTSLAPYLAACLNLFRGAYGEPERAWTRNGMRINVHDRIGIKDAGLEQDQAFEAGWTPKGAVCLTHPCVRENGSLAVIAVAILRLAGRTGPEYWTEERAAALGGLGFNRSDAPG